jgi:acyl-CoA thioesterase I
MSLVLFFVSGDSLYLGAALLLAVIVASMYLRSRSALAARNIAAWLALALMVLASPPFSWVVCVAFVAAFLFWFVASNTAVRSGAAAWLRPAAAAVLFLFVVALSASELVHRRMPVITGTPSDHLVVIGDSISAGIDPRSPTWPMLYEKMTGVGVKNLATPGAVVADGRAMLYKVTPDDRVFLIELGGNDLLSGEPSATFSRNLETLLSKIAAPGRTIVMFELPLLPTRTEYGRIQRQLASKYGLWLIPKHNFTAVISGPDATLDGLHLSETGARRMASLVARALSSVVKASDSR